jgi:hypothetical protein
VSGSSSFIAPILPGREADDADALIRRGKAIAASRQRVFDVVELGYSAAV